MPSYPLHYAAHVFSNNKKSFLRIKLNLIPVCYVTDLKINAKKIAKNKIINIPGAKDSGTLKLMSEELIASSSFDI